MILMFSTKYAHAQNTESFNLQENVKQAFEELGGRVKTAVSVIRYSVPFHQQQHPAVSVYKLLKQLVGSIRHITKRIK